MHIINIQDFTSFEKVLDQVHKLSQTIKTELWQTVKTFHYTKGEHILEQGKVEHYMIFLYEGTIRAYQNKEGEEISLDFRFSGQMITAYTSYISQKPSPVAIDALKDCKVMKIHRNDVNNLFDKYHEFERLGRLMSEYFYLRRVEREIEILAHNAEERYKHLLEKHPELVREIPVKYLASYLGIQKQSLSRIRAKIRL